MEDIKAEAFFFWEYDQATQRWIPKMLIYLNNTSGMPLTLDRIEVTFSNITYSDGKIENDFSLSLSKRFIIPIGGLQAIIVLSEYGFTEKPAYFDLELKLHIWEAKGSIIITTNNSTKQHPITHILEEIELQIDLLASGQALVTYYMTFRNLEICPVTIVVAVRYFQERYTLDENYEPYISDLEAGSLHVERDENGTLLYADPYTKTIDGRDTYTVFIRYMLKDLVKEQFSKKIVRDIQLIQLPHVHYATLKVRIPKNAEFFHSLDIDSIKALPPPDEIYEGDYYTMEWKTSLFEEMFYVIKLEEISYSYFFDFSKLGFTPSGIMLLVLGAILGFALERFWSHLIYPLYFVPHAHLRVLYDDRMLTIDNIGKAPVEWALITVRVNNPNSLIKSVRIVGSLDVRKPEPYSGGNYFWAVVNNIAPGDWGRIEFEIKGAPGISVEVKSSCQYKRGEKQTISPAPTHGGWGEEETYNTKND